MAQLYDNTVKKDRVLLAAVDTGAYDTAASLDELEELVKTADGEPVVRVVQKRPSYDKAIGLHYRETFSSLRSNS